MHNVLATIETTDPEFFWITSAFSRRVAAAPLVPDHGRDDQLAHQAADPRYLEETSDDPAGQLAFKLHDFGARGVSSLESAGLGGLAHLVNFKGTDTVAALVAARRYYDEKMAGFPIPAAEHSHDHGLGPRR